MTIKDLFRAAILGNPLDPNKKPDGAALVDAAGTIDEQIAEISAIVTIGVKQKAAATIATTGNITLSGEQTIDGVLTSSTRVLVKSQSSAAQNGLYVSAAGAWTRATDMDTSTEFPGANIFVRQGTVNKGTTWRCTNTTNPTVGSTAITFELSGEVDPADYTSAGSQAAAVAAFDWGAKSEGVQHDYRSDAGVVRDLTTPANSYAGRITDRATFSRASTAYRRNKSGSLASVSSDVLRFEHNKDGKPIGVRIEPSKTNLMLQSDTFTNAAWSKANVTVTAAALTSRGIAFTKLEVTTTAATSVSNAVSSAGSALGNTAQIFMKRGSGATEMNQVVLRNDSTATNLIAATIDLSTGQITYTVGTSGITVESWGDDIWLVSVKGFSGISAGNTLRLYVGSSGASRPAGQYVYVAKAAMFAGPGSSPIDTTTGSVTRAADVLQESFTLDASEGTLFCEWGAVQLSTTAVLIDINDGNTNNLFRLAITAGLVQGRINAGGVTQVLINGLEDLSAGGKLAMAWRANDVMVVANGTLVGTDLVATIPTGLNNYRIGNSATGGSQIDGVIVQDEFIPRRMSLEELIELTTVEQTGPTSATIGEPAPSQPVLAPRLFGMVGIETNVYHRNAISSLAPKGFNWNSTLGTGQGQKHLDECWRINPAAEQLNHTLTLQVLDLEHDGTVFGEQSMALDVVADDAAKTANGGVVPTKNVVFIGQSTTDAVVGTDRYMGRILENCADFPDSAQITLMGSRSGNGAIKHEGRGGWATTHFLDSYTAGAYTNAFIDGPGNRFDASYWVTNTGLGVAPDIVGWDLFANDVYGATSDGAAHDLMDTALANMDLMIGLTTAAGVTGWIAVDPAIAHLVFMLLPAGDSQDGAGIARGDTNPTMARWKRNSVIASHRIREHYANSEGDKVFLVPINTALDTHNGWQITSTAASAATTRMVDRMQDDIHPLNTVASSPLGAYAQWGDQITAAINVLIAKGLI